MTGRARIGTSGWLYPPWRGDFYPPKLPHRRELDYLSSRLNSVEINGTFYSLQRPTFFHNIINPKDGPVNYEKEFK